MANIKYVTKNNLNESYYNAKKTLQRIFLFIGLLLIILSLRILIITPFLVLLLWVIYKIISPEKDQIRSAGERGENLAIEILSKLPDGYILFNQVNIPNKKSTTGYNEADVIVWGPNAIFTIEVKHNKGTISGCEDDQEWRVDKIGRGGTPYVKTMRNPIKQAKNLVWNLGNHLDKKNAKPWIQGIALFTNDHCKLDVTRQTTFPILTTENLNNYILHFGKKSKDNRIWESKKHLIELKINSSSSSV